MSEDNKKKLDQTFKATLSNEAHGGYFSLSSFSALGCWSPRYSTTDHWIQESIKWIFDLGLQRKKTLQTPKK